MANPGNVQSRSARITRIGSPLLAQGLGSTGDYLPVVLGISPAGEAAPIRHKASKEGLRGSVFCCMVYAGGADEPHLVELAVAKVGELGQDVEPEVEQDVEHHDPAVQCRKAQLQYALWQTHSAQKVSSRQNGKHHMRIPKGHSC